MEKVYFSNSGEFDPVAMLTFGVSVKDEGAIGYFGTGFKYAVAIILRLGGSIEVASGGNRYVFSKQEVVVKGKAVDVVFCNEDNAGFTTHLGVNWEPWMAYRELYSNCIDEGGVVGDEPAGGDTVIEVTCPDIYRAYLDTDQYFLSTEKLHSGPNADIHKKASSYIYYKGVAVGQFDGIYSYNLKSVELTEDRTMKYPWQLKYALQREIQGLDDSGLIRKIITPGEHAETKLGFDPDYFTTDSFAETAAQMMKTNVGICESARKLMECISFCKGNWPEIEITAVQRTMLERASVFLLGINVDVSDFPIKVVSGLGDGVMGRAHEGVIYLSDLPFQMGTKQLASTLLEEWVHNKFGCADFDRQMQSWLFDKILSIGEELNGEPV